MTKITFNKRQSGEWVVFDLVPDILVVHAGIQGGEPTVKGTRVPTVTAECSFKGKDWGNYRITELQAFASMCFEAGRQYQKQHKAIDKVVNEVWGEYNKKHYPDIIADRGNKK